MGLLYSPRNNSKLGISHWVRVAALLMITAALTWYGKFYQAKPRISREHGIAAWMIPHSQGLSVLLALPDDGNDSNRVQSGMRLWLRPPREPAGVVDPGGIRYRGASMAIVGDSLPLLALEQIATSVDTGGQILWLGSAGWPEDLAARALGPRQFIHAVPAAGAHDWLDSKRTGEDVKISLTFAGQSSQDFTLDLLFNGYRMRFWSSPRALSQDSSHDTLSVGVLLFPLARETSIPLLHEKRIATLIWNGPPIPGADSTRIALGEPESMALAASDEDWSTLRVRRLHLKGWMPREQ